MSKTQAEDVEYLRPPAEFSTFRIGPLTEEAGRFPAKKLVVIQWQRLKAAEKTGRLAGQTKNGRISIMGFGTISGDSGTEKLQDFFALGSGLNNIAIWIEAPAYGKKRFLLSNVSSRGDAGVLPRSRPMSQAEQAEYREHIRINSPPPNLPPRHRSVSSSSMLRPGMLIQAAHMGEWGDAEVLAIDPSAGVTVRLIDHQDKLVMLQPKQWLAVPSGKIESLPGGPTVQVLPGTTAAIPDQAKVLSTVQNSVHGMPVKFAYMQKLHDGFLIDRRGTKARVRYSFASRQHEKDVEAFTVIVEKGIIDQLGRPGFDTAMAKNLDVHNSKAASLGMRDYPMRGVIPRTHERVPENVTIPSQTALQAWWGSKFYDVKSLADSPVGPIPVRWADWSESWDCRILREQLIIAKSDLRRIQKARGDRRLAGSNASQDASSKMRFWTDTTGKFRVKAEFVCLENGNVTLLSDQGKTIRVPLDRLSKTDQASAQELQNEEQNPFQVID
ncbi:MAG: SHD1 domain-containing protein [Planctomycetota bacterium]